MNRESEYLPETTQPLPADQGDGVETRINQGIPGSFFYDPGIFFLLFKNPLASRRLHAQHRSLGGVRFSSQERIQSMVAEGFQRMDFFVAFAMSTGSDTVCRQYPAVSPPVCWNLPSCFSVILGSFLLRLFSLEPPEGVMRSQRRAQPEGSAALCLNWRCTAGKITRLPLFCFASKGERTRCFCISNA